MTSSNAPLNITFPCAVMAPLVSVLVSFAVTKYQARRWMYFARKDKRQRLERKR